MGRHHKARNRRNWSPLLAAGIAPAAVFFVLGSEVNPTAGGGDADPAVNEVAPGGVEVVAVAPIAHSSAPAGAQLITSSAPREMSASRWRVIDVTLPTGVAPEEGLQVRTILVARSISAVFPEIQNIGGVRPDSLRWHPDGLALDVNIPNPDSAEGITLGNEIVAFVLKNSRRFGIQDAIWCGTYYTPSGPSGSGAGHYDHVHITTTGGGYPTGSETYSR